MTDALLVRRALAGETAAYGQLARRWSPRVLAVCHARTGRVVAEDLAQETLLRGLRALPTLADPERFGPWLVGIAVRVCLDWLKSAQRTEVSLDSAGSSDVAPEPDDRADRAGAEKRERAERLLAAVERLPQPYRDVLMLYYYNDCTYQELAEMLGVSAATINLRLTRARAMLRQAMLAERD